MSRKNTPTIPHVTSCGGNRTFKTRNLRAGGWSKQALARELACRLLAITIPPWDMGMNMNMCSPRGWDGNILEFLEVKGVVFEITPFGMQRSLDEQRK